MSAGSVLTKSAIIIALMAGFGYSLKNYRSVSATYANDVKQTSALRKQYAKELKEKPTVKHVTTNYQKALKVANAYMKASDEFHDVDQSDFKARDKAAAKMQKYSQDEVNGPMVSPLIKGWHGEVSYGGQNSDGNVLIAFTYKDDQNKIMQMTTCYYHPNSGKLSGFTTFMSKDGSNINRSSLKD